MPIVLSGRGVTTGNRPSNRDPFAETAGERGGGMRRLSRGAPPAWYRAPGAPAPIGRSQRTPVFSHALCAFRRWPRAYGLRLWWPQTLKPLTAAAPRGPPRCGRQARGGLRRPWPESIEHTAQRASISRRLAGGGQHGRALWAWCWSFVCWLHGSHGLPRCSLCLLASFMACVLPPEHKRSGKYPRLPHLAVACQVGEWLQSINRKVYSIHFETVLLID